MAIIEFALIEILTIFGAFVIAVDGIIDAMVRIFENGYKFDKNRMERVKKLKENENGNEKHEKKSPLGVFLMVTPVVNVIWTGIRFSKLRDKIMDYPEIRELLTPMTDNEKEFYSRLNDRNDKIKFMLLSMSVDKMDGIGHMALINEALPDTYTLDEVKKLNRETMGTYRLGMVDSVPTAIIGIPDKDRIVTGVKFKNEDYKMSHNYVNMSEWDVEDKRFIVYTFPCSYDDEIEQCREEIILRRNKNKCADLQTNNEVPSIESEYENIELGSDTRTDEPSGPTLKKKYRKNKY